MKIEVSIFTKYGAYCARIQRYCSGEGRPKNMHITVPELYTRVFNKIVSTPVTPCGHLFARCPFQRLYLGVCFWALKNWCFLASAWCTLTVYINIIYIIHRDERC